MDLDERKLFIETHLAARDFLNLAPWVDFDDDHSFAVVVPGEEHPLVASIMGCAGQEFGLTLFRGPGAAAGLNDLVNEVRSMEEMMENLSFVDFSAIRYGDLPKDKRKTFKKAGFKPRPGDAVPLFLAKEPGRQVHEPTRREMESAFYALSGINAAYEEGLLTPALFEPGEGLPLLTVAGDPLNPEVSVGTFDPASPAEATVTRLPPPVEDLDDLPRLPDRWIVGLPVLPASIKGDGRSLRALFVADEGSPLLRHRRSAAHAPQAPWKHPQAPAGPRRRLQPRPGDAQPLRIRQAETPAGAQGSRLRGALRRYGQGF